MKKILIAAAVAMAPAAAFAQAGAPAAAAGPAAPAAPVAAKGYNTTDTTIGTLLADPAAKAVVEKHFAGLTTSDQIQMAAGMTMRQLQGFKPDMFTDEALSATDADLAKLPPK